jgi:sensor domain CHASE-containing protein
MDPSNIIMWAVCIGVAWLIFASLTGADEWLRSQFGNSKSRDLQERVERLEKRLDELSKK